MNSVNDQNFGRAMRPSLALNTIAAIFILAAPAALQAQHAIGVRWGKGDGTAQYSVSEMNARFQAKGRLYITGLVQFIEGDWACAGTPADLLRCEYDGTIASLGVALAAIQSRNVYVGLNGGGGGFVRTHYQLRRAAKHWTGNIAAEAEVSVWEPIRIQVAIAHRRIFDGQYRDAFGERPNFTSITGGVTLVLGPARN